METYAIPCFQGWKKQHLLDPVKCWGVTGFTAARGCPVSEDGRPLSHGAHTLKARCSRPAPGGGRGQPRLESSREAETQTLCMTCREITAVLLPGKRIGHTRHVDAPFRGWPAQAPAAHAARSVLWDPCSCLTAVVGTLPEGRPLFAGTVTCEDLV